LGNLNTVANMLEISMVQSDGTYDQMKNVVKAATDYGCPCIYVLESFFDAAKQEMETKETRTNIGCGVGFPSGGESLKVKLFQMEHLLDRGCDEIDVVINLGKFLSGEYDYVEKELNAIMSAARSKPVKAIIEVTILSKSQIEDISKLCMACCIDYIKTGTGWMNSPTTIDHVEIIKKAINGQIKIKASGGIRNLSTIKAMSDLGVSRFGVNYNSAMSILDECKLLDNN